MNVDQALEITSLPDERLGHLISGQQARIVGGIESLTKLGAELDPTALDSARLVGILLWLTVQFGERAESELEAMIAGVLIGMIERAVATVTNDTPTVTYDTVQTY